MRTPLTLSTAPRHQPAATSIALNGFDSWSASIASVTVCPNAAFVEAYELTYESNEAPRLEARAAAKVRGVSEPDDGAAAAL